MAKKRRNKIVYIPNQSLHEKWWAYDAEGRNNYTSKESIRRNWRNLKRDNQYGS